jgi:hypothetical protein
MASHKEHNQKLQHNHTLLQEPLICNNKYYDWAIIIAFYEALHYVDRVLDIFPSAREEEYDSHKKRRTVMKRYSVLRSILDEYDSLLNESWRARYTCEILTRKDYEKALEYLYIIQDALRDIEAIRKEFAS